MSISIILLIVSLAVVLHMTVAAPEDKMLTLGVTQVQVLGQSGKILINLNGPGGNPLIINVGSVTEKDINGDAVGCSGNQIES